MINHTLTCSRCKAEAAFQVEAADVAHHKTPERLAIEAAKAKGWRRVYKPRVKLYCQQCVAVKFPKKRGPKPRKGLINVAVAARMRFEGKTLAEIGRRYGVSRQAVRQRLS